MIDELLPRNWCSKHFPGGSSKRLLLALVGYVCTFNAQAFDPSTPEYVNQPALSTINAIAAYNAGLSGNGVRIGIVDRGIDPNHLEFTNAIVAGLGWSRSSSDLLTSDNWVATTGTSNFASFLSDVQADGTTIAGHGTFVASLAAARLDNAARADNIMGVAHNASLVIGQDLIYQCQRDPVNVGCLKDASGSTIWKALGSNDAQTAQSIDYVSAQGVKVINNSWGVDADWNIPMTTAALQYETLNPLITAALKRAVDRGAVIVFAAGNDSVAWPITPATLPSVDPDLISKGGWIVVAATTNRGVDAQGQIEMAQSRNPLVPPAQ